MSTPADGRGHQPPPLGGRRSDVASGSSPQHAASRVVFLAKARQPLTLRLLRASLRLGNLTVVAGAVLGGALGRPAGLGALQAVAFGASGRVGQRVRASVHHDGVHAVGHGEGLEVRLDGDGQRQLVDEVHRRARHDGSAAEVLQAEDCGGKCRSGYHDDNVIL